MRFVIPVTRKSQEFRLAGSTAEIINDNFYHTSGCGRMLVTDGGFEFKLHNIETILHEITRIFMV